jgi:hypothetical protein
MQMPTPSEAHQKLQALLGAWIGTETISPSPWGPGGTAVGKNELRLDLDGFFVVQDYVQERDGTVSFRGHGLFGWDGEKKAYAWYWVDSMGFVPDGPAYGQWQGDTLALAKSTPRGQARYTFRFDSERSYRFTIENSFDGGATWLTFMEAVYHRS